MARKSDNWVLDNPPRKPTPIAREPSRTKTITTPSYRSEPHVVFDGAVIQLNELVKGYNIPDDINLVFSRDDDDDNLEVRAEALVETVVPNERYERQLAVYERDLKEDAEALEQWTKDMGAYILWEKRARKELLEKQLAEAEELLKKHGRM